MREVFGLPPRALLTVRGNALQRVGLVGRAADSRSTVSITREVAPALASLVAGQRAADVIQIKMIRLIDQRAGTSRTGPEDCV